MMTLREYIYTINDIDGYIARGGQLLDLPLHDLSSLPPPLQETFGKHVDPSAAARFGRFLEASREGMADDEILGTTITEERARDIWSGTILPPSLMWLWIAP